MARCPRCLDYGYVQVYRTVVYRDFCDCSAGDFRVEQRLQLLKELKIAPNTLQSKDRYASYAGRVKTPKTSGENCD